MNPIKSCHINLVIKFNERKLVPLTYSILIIHSNLQRIFIYFWSTLIYRGNIDKKEEEESP